MSCRPYVVTPIPVGIWGDLRPEAVEAHRTTPLLAQASAVATAVSMGNGGGQAFAVRREVPI